MKHISGKSKRRFDVRWRHLGSHLEHSAWVNRYGDVLNYRQWQHWHMRAPIEHPVPMPTRRELGHA